MRGSPTELRQSLTPVGVAAKHEHPLSRDYAQRILNWLSARGIPAEVDEEVAGLLPLSADDNVTVRPRRDLGNHCPVVVVLGGDGTLISVSRHPSPRPPIIVGINLGTLGFLTEIRLEELFSTLELVLSGHAPVERRYLLHITVRRPDPDESLREIASYYAINDVVLSKEALARIFGVRVVVNGEEAAVLRGDGVIVATPGGSTAYSLSAGGSIVHPQVDAILLTPICPHSLTSRPLVLPGYFKIGLCVGSKKDGNLDKVYLTVDGQDGMELNDGDEVQVTTSKESVLFVRSPLRSYFDVLGTKLKWAKL